MAIQEETQMIEQASACDASQTSEGLDKPENVDAEPTSDSFDETEEASPVVTTEDAEASPVVTLEDSWGRGMLQVTNENRQVREEPSFAWDDACMIQAQSVAQHNANEDQQGKSFFLGDQRSIKDALVEAGHEDCCGTFRVTAKTKELTMDASTTEAVETLKRNPDIWTALMNEKARKGAFAAVLRGNRVHWAGIFMRTLDDMSESDSN